MNYLKNALSLFFIFGVMRSIAVGYDNPALNKVRFQTAPSHSPLELVKNGELQFCLVADLAADSAGRSVPSGKKLGRHRQSARIAVEILKKNLQKTTGKIPAVLSPDSPELKQYRYQLLVGKSILTDKLGIDISRLPKEGFMLRTFAGGIALVGHDGNRIPGFYEDLDLNNRENNGTVNGAYDFCERILGMRFYYPGLGIYVPSVKNLTVRPVAYTDGPKFFFRSMGQKTSKGFNPPQGKQQKLGHTGTMTWPWPDIPFDQTDFHRSYREAWNTRFLCSESPHPFDMAKAFPDKLDLIFGRDKDGKLFYSDKVYTRNYFNVGNPEFVDFLASCYKKFYDSNGKWSPIWTWFHPTPEYMCFGPVDTHKIIDNDYTRKFRRKNPNKSSIMSEINGNFYLQLARKVEELLPGKKLAVMAYANYLYPPETIEKYPDNLRVMVCCGTPVYIRHPGYVKFWEAMYGGWNSKTAGKAVPYVYDPSYTPEGGISHALRGMFEGEYLRKMAPYISDEEAFICIQLHWNYYYSAYLAARSYWNPEFDAQAALDEHWELFFGKKSAPYLKQFYALLIDRWVNHYLPALPVDRRCIPGIDYKLLYSKGFNRDTVNQMKSLLQNAKKNLPADRDARRRFEFFAMPWDKIMGQIMAYGCIRPAQYNVRYAAAGQIRLDGIPDEAVWKKGRTIRLNQAFYGQKPTDGNLPDIRLMWNEQGMYIAYQGKAPYNKAGKLWGEDNFEFFLSPGQVKNQVFQLVFSSSGLHEDYLKTYNPPREVDPQWTCANLKKAIHADDKGWSAEVFIPFKSLEKSAPPLAGDYWFGNVVVNPLKKKSLSLAVTLGNNYNAETYARFYFAGNCE